MKQHSGRTFSNLSDGRRLILHRLISVLILVGFFLILLGPIVMTDPMGGKISPTENRYLATFPDLFDKQGHLSANLRSGLEAWLGDNIGFRSIFMDLAAKIKVKLIHQSPTDRVEIGRDGWYFYTVDHHLDIARGTYPDFDEIVLQRICRQQEKIRAKLKSQGIEYVLILPPSKASIYPEYISSGDYSVTETPADMLADYLEDNSDVAVVRLKQVLLDAKQRQQVYFKTDTHWNEYGAYVACTKIAKDLTQRGIMPDKEIQVTFDRGEYMGEFSAMMGSSGLLGAETCPKSIIVNATAQTVESGEMHDKLAAIMQEYNIHTPFYTYVNLANENAPRALIFGDSMFGSWNVTQQLAEHFSQLTYIWDYNINADVIEAVKPDILLYEMVERYLNLLPNESKEYLKTTLINPQAEIMDIHIEGNTMNVTVQNTGSSAWSYMDDVACCLWNNGVDSGYRASLPFDAMIEPGDQVTLTFSNVDVDSIIRNVVEVQMLQEGICYFGEKERIY